MKRDKKGERDLRRFLLIGLLVLCAYSFAAEKLWEQVVHYPSVNPNGDTILLSGKISVPVGKTPKGILLIPHYTISADSEAPSNTKKGEGKIFRKDYIVLMPDLIGYGLTKDLVHPYLDGELTARNTVDLLLYAQPIIDSVLHKFSIFNFQFSINIVGFSQGGAAALWTLKLLEEQYADRIHVRKCFAGSGPYDVAVTYDDAIMRNYTFLPLVIPMMVMGTNEAYDLHLRQEDFFTEAAQQAYTRLIRDKQSDITKLFFLMPHHKVDYWFTPQGMDKSQPETRRLYEGMLRSSLVHFPIDDSPVGADSICPDWIPRTPVYVFHSTKDNIVTFHCAQHLRRCFGEQPNITYDFGNYGNHPASCFTFFKRVKKLLEKETADD